MAMSAGFVGYRATQIVDVRAGDGLTRIHGDGKGDYQAFVVNTSSDHSVGISCDNGITETMPPRSNRMFNFKEVIQGQAGPATVVALIFDK